MNLQWYQWVGLAVTGLGLSPVPWITMLLTGRLMPLSAHLERVGDLKATHARELANAQADLDRVTADRDFERQATRIERDRADAAAGKLAALTEGFGKVAVGLLASGEKRLQSGEVEP